MSIGFFSGIFLSHLVLSHFSTSGTPGYTRAVVSCLAEWVWSVTKRFQLGRIKKRN